VTHRGQSTARVGSDHPESRGEVVQANIGKARFRGRAEYAAFARGGKGLPGGLGPRTIRGSIPLLLPNPCAPRYTFVTWPLPETDRMRDP
jgi:hypothetical protein